MAARIRKTHQDEVRAKIQASQIINRLQDHIFKNIDMSKTQVSAALGLLRKSVPDLSATQLTGPNDGPLQVQQVEIAIVDPVER